MSVSIRSLLALSVGALVFAGCAQEQPPINRVQPDYYEKDFFVGADYLNANDDPEFYSQGTLVDVGYGAGMDGLFTSTYAQPLSRVKWTITEDWLIARLAYERIRDSDFKGTGKATNDGVVVAAYPILRHFDIQRSYNPTTGEQLNVFEENTTDRPWYERKYIRVDWSKNHSTDNYDFDTLSQIGIFGGIEYEPMAYYVNDPHGEDRPHFDPEHGYLDITNKAWAKPQTVDISSFGWGLGVVPTCWFNGDFMGGGAPATQCNPVELTIRQSFYRVDQRNPDYEPAEWDGYRFQAFGAFTTDRYGYARNYGITDTQQHRLINRYNIWERTHYYSDPEKMEGAIACYTPATTKGLDPHRDLDGNGTEDECEAAGPGSRCDTFAQKCTLPFKDRKPVSIPWFFTNGSDQEYFDATADAVHQWDVALRAAIQAARFAECQATNAGDCFKKFPAYFGQQDENDDAIALAKEVDDCRRGKAYPGWNCDGLADSLGKDRGYSPGVIALAKMPEEIVLCHSPLEATDPDVCNVYKKNPGEVDGPLPPGITAAQCDAARTANDDPDLLTKCDTALNVRKGDLRFHQVNAIKTPQSPSPWGIMVDANDPLTGETISASINVWTFVNDLWSEGIVDTARYIKGELTTSDITEGTYVEEWARAAEAASQHGALPPVTRQQLEENIASFSGKTVQQLDQSLKQIQLVNPQVLDAARELKREIDFSVRADAKATSVMKPIYEARRKHAIGTATEAALTTPMMQSYSGATGIPSSDIMMELASPLRGANPEVQAELKRMKELAWAERGACMVEQAPAPFAIADLADVLEQKFGNFNPADDRATQLARAEKMRNYLKKRAHTSVITHEMGHSIGLRHNFVSSSDAWNYRPQYWQLRTDNGKNTNECQDLDPTGSCVGPRYFDPINENERKNLITMFMTSSTMEYPGEALQDMMGLGAYDFAAAKMFYGDVASIIQDNSFNAGTARGIGVMEKLDNFGGILGFQPSIGSPIESNPTRSENIHYSQLNKYYDLIFGCHEVDPTKFKPADWDEETKGAWNPLLDGLLVQVDGKYTRCRQQPLDYLPWNSLRDALPNEVARTNGRHEVDPKTGRVRFPFGFATDRWADLGNVAVYRHDNGADPYELFDFLITQQEVNHIFDNYRRNRATFSVRAASDRTLTRYNTKIRDAAKGLGLYANIYRDFAYDEGLDYDTLWPAVADLYFKDNILAANIAFDHFARQMARPQAGPHYLSDVGTLSGKAILRSAEDAPGNPEETMVNVPNGATGLFRNVVPGGRPLENALSDNHGEYDSEYTINAGSYYDKAWATMLMTESVDNFISASRRDFLDARYRSVSMADVFPQQYRRWLANNLTGDEEIKGTRIEVDATGAPIVEQDLFPVRGIGWTSWSSTTPQTCFVGPDNLQCSTTTQNTLPIDSQIGWEQQKFLIAWTLQYLPENQQQIWLNQMGIWELGADSNPDFDNRIEYHSPTGKTYIAKTFGKEQVFGKTVQKGIAARMLEYANQLLAKAYDTDPGPDLDGDGEPDWYEPKLGSDGQPHVKWDPDVDYVDAGGGVHKEGGPGCNATDNSKCTCTSNRACVELSRYEEVPFFLRQAMHDYGLADPSMKGIY
ncbi:MAG: hypothetical protein IRZ16_17110 [Myxococcaceae bacterium]|nr:hypothetical protein [Myxococcaceae bacterium]